MEVIHTGDCVEFMRTMDAESIDAIVTDPPYGIRFMGKAWDGAEIEAQAKADKAKRIVPDDGGRRTESAFGNDAGYAGAYNFTLKGNAAFQAWCTTWAREAFRVAKPGAHLLAFGGTRTYHRLASAIEDAGWEIRDCLVWAYASGFPKSLNFPDGFGTALKPAWEPIVMARRPLIGTVAANRERHGTGALNIGATRIAHASPADAASHKANSEPWTRHERGDSFLAESKGMHTPGRVTPVVDTSGGRWPANVILTDAIFDGDISGVVGGGYQESTGIPGKWAPRGAFPIDNPEPTIYGDSGTYSRFFLIPKASRSNREPVLRGQLAERESLIYSEKAQGPLPQQTPSRPSARENAHPTVKPVDLMRHLVRLVTPPGGTVLDPFLGSGTTAIACEMEGFAWIGNEKEPEYVAIAEARLNGTQKGMAL